MKVSYGITKGKLEMLPWNDPRTGYIRFIIDEETGRFKLISLGESEVYGEVVYYKGRNKVNFRKTFKNYEKACEEWNNNKPQHDNDCQCEACRRKLGDID